MAAVLFVCESAEDCFRADPVLCELISGAGVSLTGASWPRARCGRAVL